MDITKFKESYFSEIMTKDIVSLMKEKFGPSITLDIIDTKLSYYNNKEFLAKLIQLIEEETVSIEYFKEFISNPLNFNQTIKDIINLIFELKESGILPTKSLSLYQQFNIHIYTEKYKKEQKLEKLAYKNVKNIKNEVLNLYNHIFEDSIESIDPYKFLNINDRLPDMMVDKDVTFYSFLLNYDGELIVQNNLLDAIFELSDIDSESFGFGSNSLDNIVLWNDLSTKYRTFFYYLKENTLN